MAIRHVPILKAKQGEFKALVQNHDFVSSRLLPLFEVGRITESISQSKYLIESQTPVITYLDRVAKGIFESWGGRPAMIDAYLWPADAMTEDGDHIIAYLVQHLEDAGMPIVPVIGYDRWEHEVYKAGMKGMNLSTRRSVCLRLDSHAIDDAAEPEYFQDWIADIVESLGLLPSRCSILIDFGDVSSTSLSDLIDGATNIISHLEPFGFHDFITAGCSIPKSIDLAVKSQDSVSMVIRREMLLWKALRQEIKGIPILYGDYGVRGPGTNDDVRSKYTNGKIRYTTDQQTFVVRGHPITYDHSYDQMHDLADKVIKSPHYLGADFSWGDERVNECRSKKFKGSPTQWIAIDTNHHFAYATQEVEAFELSVVVADAGDGP